MKRNTFFVFLSAVLLTLSFSNFKLWVLAWFGFVPLLFAIENKSKTKAFFLSYLTGIIFWSGTIYWLIHVTLLGTIILVLYLALFFGLFGLIVTKYEIRNTKYAIVFIPSVWVILEFIRGNLFTGFPWALLGYSQYLNLPAIQIADITGAWGVSFLVMMVNITVYSILDTRYSILAGKRKYLTTVLAVVVVLIYGYYRIYHRPGGGPLRR
ncbi:hypothetical protein ACFL1K_01950 [Candidatus Omnitrophota bacterium]